MSIHEALKKYWGYDSFRPLQEDIIQSVLDGKDTLALMPTGGGKSICFQVPALTQEGMCLVISPLIALMKDQVYNLEKRNIKAVAIYSGMHSREIDRMLDNCIYGDTKFLYLSPERLKTPMFKERLHKMNINLVAIDEAHCISQWGYDFRPPYKQIAEIREFLPKVPFLALTATATKRVQQDIMDSLAFPTHHFFQKSYKRANLSYSVFHEEHKLRKLIHILKNVDGTGIVYVRNRKKTKEVAYLLQKQRISADFYHAGLDPKSRSAKQEKWIRNQIRVMVCTNAFGMGIDKPDVRIVVHIDLPESLEAYYQEAGRAGRDLKKSYAVLLYNEADKINLERNFENSFPPIETIKKTYQSLGNYFKIATEAGEGQSFDFDLIDFYKTYNLSPIPVYSSLKILEQNEYISTNDAMYMPSRLLFTVSKEDLYKFEVANRRLEPYIRTLLRTYGGAFDNYVEIKEREIARNMKTSEQYVQNALLYLQQKKILNYVPQTDKPQITYTCARVKPSSLMIDQKMLKFRKKIRRENINSVVAYATNEINCRSQQLVTYFGELDSTPCGVCDLCLARKKQKAKDAIFENIQAELKVVLQEKAPVTLAQFIQQSRFKEAEIIKVVRWMVDNGALKVGSDKVLSLTS